jgi:hypothetical protein
MLLVTLYVMSRHRRWTSQNAVYVANLDLYKKSILQDSWDRHRMMSYYLALFAV